MQRKPQNHKIKFNYAASLLINTINNNPNKNKISEQFKGKFDNWLFGCDICQDVCPWNQKFLVETLIKDFHPQNKELKLDDILDLNEDEFKAKFQTSPIKRAKLAGIKRNANFLKSS